MPLHFSKPAAWPMFAVRSHREGIAMPHSPPETVMTPHQKNLDLMRIVNRTGCDQRRAAHGRRSAFSAGYGHPLRPWLLPLFIAWPSSFLTPNHRPLIDERPVADPHSGDLAVVLAHLVHALESSARASRRLQIDQFTGTNDALYATYFLTLLSLRPAGPTSSSGRLSAL
jgi:hypothetical protein